VKNQAGGVVAAKDQNIMLADLRELVKALDRRVPRLERAGEDKIACEAAALRVKAMQRIAQLQRPTAPRSVQ